jgi:small subunit ribosomal protein S14
MAKRSLILKAQKKPKFSTRVIRRCRICGRKRAYMRDFGLCRICFREKASTGQLPGITKSSW